MKRYISVGKILNILSLLCIMLVITCLGMVLKNKKEVNAQIIKWVEDSESVDEASEKLSENGYKNYIDENKLMVKVNGIWNTLYYEQYLTEENGIESETIYSK